MGDKGGRKDKGKTQIEKRKEELGRIDIAD